MKINNNNNNNKIKKKHAKQSHFWSSSYLRERKCKQKEKTGESYIY